MWLLALYQVVAEEQAGPDADLEAVHAALAGTTQNDIIKEYLSRGTYVFPPEHSLRLTSDLIAYTVNHIPKWNPINICSYHLQEAGATPVQELAYALCTAIAVLDTVRDSGQVAPRTSARSSAGSRSSSTPACGSSRRPARCGRSCELWDEITRERYGVEDEKMRRFRYGVQVNSLGLTEAQPENNVQRIVLEMLGVTLSKDARARAVQLPAWNEALGLPASLGPAVVAAAAAGAGLRVRPAGVRRPLRGLARDRGEGRRAGRAPARRWTGCRRWAGRSRPSSPAT